MGNVQCAPRSSHRLADRCAASLAVVRFLSLPASASNFLVIFVFQLLSEGGGERLSLSVFDLGVIVLINWSFLLHVSADT